MATVFLALDLALDRKVAIKVMSPSLTSTPGAIERFRREARTAAALSHPHIVPIYAIGDDPELAFYVMKYIEGRSLDSVLHEEGAQSPAFVQAILAYVGNALHHAHLNGVVHRDVKPANIMLDRDGWTYVTDFGIAKRDDGHGLTQSGMIIGTPAYMCPEQFNGQPVTGAADQYALGIVAYELLAGKTPYDGPSLGEVMRGHLLEPVPPVRAARPDVPEALETCVTRMLAKDAKDRFATLAEAVAAIGAVSPSVESEARTTFIRLARAADQTRPQMNVPQSPVPGTYRSSAGPTVRTPIATRRSLATPPPAAQPEPVRRRSSLFRIFILLVLVGVFGLVMKRVRDADQLAKQRLATAAPTAAGEAPPPGPAAAVVQDSLVAGGGAAAASGDTSAATGAASLPVGVVGGGVPAGATPITPESAAVTKDAPPDAPPDAPSAARPEQRSAPQEAGGQPNRRDPGGADAGNRGGAQARAMRERLDAMNDRREAAGQAPVQAGLVRIGTTGPRFTLFVNGRARQVISGRGLHDVPLPTGNVQLSLRAINCVSWDTTFTVRASQVHVIGERSPHC